MMIKLDRDQLSAEAAALDGLLASLPSNDILGRMGLQARRNEVEKHLKGLADSPEHRAKVALYFGGDPVIGSSGVEAEFGTNALYNFQDLLSKVWGGAEGGRLAPTGPVKDKSASQLHITNLVHGSFGVLLEELDERGEPLFETELSKAADQVAQYLASFASEDDRRSSETIENMNPRVFDSLRQFFQYIYRRKATFRLVEGNRDERFDHTAIERAWQRAEHSSVGEENIRVEGRLLGVIPVRRRFEFEPDGANLIIEGRVGQQFSLTYLERISTEQFAGRRWRAQLQRRTVSKLGRHPSHSYILLKLDEVEEVVSRAIPEGTPQRA